ncbi:MAG: MinD/ParA family protein [Peptococcaceae bacterium]|nr:MinD/ParA family protein [Peptococcaceae bacterium]
MQKTMRDQAYKLRKMVQQQRFVTCNEEPGLGPRVIAVTSGKGGVGKTNLVVNLGLSLAKMNERVLLFDTDIGLANVEVFLGVTARYSVRDVLFGNKSIGEIVESGPHGLRYISGGSGFLELVDLDNTQRSRVLELLRYFRENTDYILIDTGAGISRNVLSFVAAADETIIVVTPEPTSLTDAYSLIKILVKIRMVPRLYVVVNRAGDLKEAQNTFQRLRMAAEKFLEVSLMHLGTIYEDRTVVSAIKKQEPLVISQPRSVAARNVEEITRNLVLERPHRDAAKETFFRKVLRVFGLG